MSDIWPRAVGGLSPGLPVSMEALEEALRACVESYEVCIPIDSAQTPPVPAMSLPRGRHQLCPVCNMGCECACACSKQDCKDPEVPEEGFMKIRTDVSGRRSVLRPDQRTAFTASVFVPDPHPREADKKVSIPVRIHSKADSITET
eukprot:gene15924-biopygen1602